jgi:hypothetical protein
MHAAPVDNNHHSIGGLHASNSKPDRKPKLTFPPAGESSCLSRWPARHWAVQAGTRANFPAMSPTNEGDQHEYGSALSFRSTSAQPA